MGKRFSDIEDQTPSEVEQFIVDLQKEYEDEKKELELERLLEELKNPNFEKKERKMHWIKY